MTTRRTMVWLILMLVTVPAVAAAADTVQRMTGGDAIINAASFREGDRFAYDLTFRSALHEVDATVQDFLVIEVGSVGTLRLQDGAESPALPIHYEMGTPPWRLAKGEVDERRGTVYLQVPGATVLRTEETKHTVEFEEDSEGGWTREEKNETRTTYGATSRGPFNGSIKDPLTYGDVAPGDTFVHGNEVVQALFFVAGVDGRPVHETGSWNGETVYEVGHSTSSMRGGPLFFCSLRQPEVRYSDFDGGDDLGIEHVTGTIESRGWIHPQIPLPVSSSCASTFIDGEKVIEKIEIEMILAEHHPGAALVPLKRDHSGVPRGVPLQTESVVIPGLPASGELEMVFSPEEAAAVLMRAPELNDFRDTGDIPFVVTDFDHQVGVRKQTLVTIPSDVPDPLDILPPNVQEKTSYDTWWWFRLTNAQHEGMAVRLERTVDETGEIVAEDLSIESTYDGAMSANGRLFTAEDYPTKMVPFSAIQAEWLEHRGMSADEWQEEPYRSISLQHSWGSSGKHPYITATYQITNGRQAAPSGGSSWHSASGSYDAADGAHLHDRESVRDREDANARPQGPAFTSLGTATVVATEHLPVAATASGLAVMLAFVVAYFWDVIGRVVIAPFYAKIQKSKVLDHGTRDRIVDYVTANPGAALGAVRAHLGSGYGTAVHHLDTLERNGLLISRKVGRIRSYFPAGTLSPHQMDAVAAAGTDAAARFLGIVNDAPGLTQREIAVRLGVADSSVRYQAKRLLEHAQVRAVRDGRQVRYYPATPLAQA